MHEEQTAHSLRQQLAQCRSSKGFNQYPSPLRQQAVQYARMRRSQGASPGTIASELGIAITTAVSWGRLDQAPAQLSNSQAIGRRCGTSLSLVPVVVRAERTQHTACRLEVDFGDGSRLQATGVSVQDIVGIIATLRSGTCLAAQ